MIATPNPLPITAMCQAGVLQMLHDKAGGSHIFARRRDFDPSLTSDSPSLVPAGKLDYDYMTGILHVPTDILRCGPQVSSKSSKNQRWQDEEYLFENFFTCGRHLGRVHQRSLPVYIQAGFRSLRAGADAAS